ncbi:MAG: hypothetical protein QNJ33_03120 [Crocosphaera sp.]|nr:hypothetical protein [Crocosphaera sp.]
MLIPLISFIFGIAILSVSSLVYAGMPTVKNIPFVFRLREQKTTLLGLVFISLALMLGIIGYFGYIDGSLLRKIRAFLGIVGLLIMSFPILQKIKTPNSFIAKIFSFFTLKRLLIVGSIAVLVSIFLISFFDGNYGGDAYMYHLPFAARIWGIISPEQYTFEYNLEHRLKGFPLLANFLQGLFWKIFQRPEATNLLAFFSLVTLISYLKFYLKIPFYLATISLLAVPMVHMHAARSYIDLPGNVCVSILILTTYLLYLNKIPLNNKTFLLIIASAAGAAHIKFQLIPVVFITLLGVLPQVILKYGQTNENRQINVPRAIKSFLLCLAASLVVFATPIKNIIVYQNPFYPVKVEIAGIVLNHQEAPPNFMHESLRKLPPHLRWGKSVLEINAFDDRRPWPWTLGMDFISWDEEKFGVGGYFGGYVLFNLGLFIYLCIRNFNHQTKMAIILMMIMTALTPLMPQAYELRYYMYWMIVFVALNCYLVCHNLERLPDKRIVKPQYFALVAAGFMFIFMEKTNYFFTKPSFSPLSDYIKANVSQEVLEQIEDGQSVCLVGKAPHTFFYSSYFHPPRNYSLQGEFEISSEYVADKCQGRKILK